MQNLENKLQILYSNSWPEDVAKRMHNMNCEDWHVVTHSGKTIRLSGGGRLSKIPEPYDFPLLLEPLPEDEIRKEKEELERLQLEEDLLQQQLYLLELEEEEKQASFLNSTIPASSNKAPACHLAALNS